MLKQYWLSKSPLYYRFLSMKRRCNDTKADSYQYYWGRGIKVLRTSFKDFYDDMHSSYKKWLSIDRINNNWHYCKENCRWATNIEQANNRRNNYRCTYEGEEYTVGNLAIKLNVDRRSLKSNRLFNDDHIAVSGTKILISTHDSFKSDDFFVFWWLGAGGDDQIDRKSVV